jgi:hypothetical protein
MLALLRAQWAQVATVFALAALAVAAAVAAPVYVDMAGRAVAADDVTAASLSQRTISASGLRAGQGHQPATTPRRSCWSWPAGATSSTSRRPRCRPPGFATVLGVGFPAYVTATADITVDQNGTLDVRDNLCDHVVIVAGRCVGRTRRGRRQRRPVVGAERHRVRDQRPVRQRRAGPARLLDPGRRDVPAGRGRGLPAGRPHRPVLGHANFSTPGREPVYTDRRTVGACDHEAENQDVVAYPLPARSTWTASRDPVGRAGHHGAGPGAASTPAPTSRTCSTASSATGTRVGLVPASAAVPLLALCWFVLFLAIAYTAQARRHELGIVKLRGVSTRDQWSLAAAESLTPVVGGGGRRLPARAPGRVAVRAGGLRAARDGGA